MERDSTEFEDGRAERIETVTTGNSTWTVAEWNIDNDGGSDYDPKVMVLLTLQMDLILALG